MKPTWIAPVRPSLWRVEVFCSWEYNPWIAAFWGVDILDCRSEFKYGWSTISAAEARCSGEYTSNRLMKEEQRRRPYYADFSKPNVVIQINTCIRLLTPQSPRIPRILQVSGRVHWVSFRWDRQCAPQVSPARSAAVACLSKFASAHRTRCYLPHIPHISYRRWCL